METYLLYECADYNYITKISDQLQMAVVFIAYVFVLTIHTLEWIVVSATQLFKLMDKYRPETRQAKKQRLAKRAEERTKGSADKPTDRVPMVRSGVNTVTKLIEQKKAQLVVIAHDVDPIEVW